MLRLALGRDGDVEARWRALQPLDLNELDPGSFCLLPLVHTRLVAAEIEDPLSERLAGTFRSTWYRNQISLRRLAGLAADLDAEGVEHLVFGGASVASRFYPQVGLRPLPQIDLAVSPADLAAAGRVVERAAEWRSRLERPDYLRFEDAERFVVVLHAGLPSFLAGARRGLAKLPALLARSSTSIVDSATIDVPAPADELVVVCGLGARLSRPPSIQWLLDAALIAQSGSADADDVASAAEELALVAATAATLRYLEDVVGGDPVARLAQAIRSRRPGRRELLAYRLGLREDALSQAAAASLRAVAGEPVGTALRHVPREFRRLGAAAWARRSVTVARR